jgi:hypothetical protein
MMPDVFVLLAAISGGVALGGYVWSSTLRLRSRKAEYREADVSQVEPIAPASDAPGMEPAVDAPNRGDSIEAGSSISLSGVARQVRREGWRRALPGLLCAGGMLMLLVSGALALLTSLPSKVFGIAALGISLYIAISELLSFRKALRE